MDPNHKSEKPDGTYFWRRILGLAFILGLAAAIWFAPAREYLRTLVLTGMPALVIWGYRRRFITYSWTWWVSTLLILGCLVGGLVMLAGVPDKLTVRNIEEQAYTYLVEGKYDQAIEKYREMEPYGPESRMERRIREAEAQKEFNDQFLEARKLVLEARNEEARLVLENIPLNALVYRDAQELLEKIEKD